MPRPALAGQLLDAGTQPQPGGATAVVSIFLFAVEQHRETVFEGEFLEARQCRLLLQRLRHADELEPLQPADDRIEV